MFRNDIDVIRAVHSDRIHRDVMSRVRPEVAPRGASISAIRVDAPVGRPLVRSLRRADRGRAIGRVPATAGPLTRAADLGPMAGSPRLASRTPAWASVSDCQLFGRLPRLNAEE